MANQQFGILNGNSHTSQYLRDLRDSQPPTPHTFELEQFADTVADRYQSALQFLRLIKSSNPARIVERVERLVEEYENQLTLLAEFADEEGSDNTTTGARRDAGFGDMGPF